MNNVVSSDFGRELRFVGEVTLTGGKVGADREFWTKLKEDPQLFRRVIDFVMNGGYSLPSHLKLQVDYGQPIGDQYDEGNHQFYWSEMAGEFSPVLVPEEQTGIQDVDVELVSFDHTVDDLEFVKELPTQGRRFATTREMFAIGSQYPHLQLGMQIVNLLQVEGSVRSVVLRSMRSTKGGLIRECLPVHLYPGFSLTAPGIRYATVRL